MQRHIEDDLQVACVNWFNLQFPQVAYLLHHSPNGGKRDSREAARFKRMGVRAGFPDLILLLPSSEYHYLAVELKTKTGRQSQLQKEYERLIQEHGGKYIVCRDVEDFAKQVKAYLWGKVESVENNPVVRANKAYFQFQSAMVKVTLRPEVESIIRQVEQDLTDATIKIIQGSISREADAARKELKKVLNTK